MTRQRGMHRTKTISGTVALMTSTKIRARSGSLVRRQSSAVTVRGSSPGGARRGRCSSRVFASMLARYCLTTIFYVAQATDQLFDQRASPLTG